MDKRIIIGVAALIVAGVLLVFQSQPDGKELFHSEGCIGCHTFRGEGGEIGPDLTAVTRRRSDAWIRQQIRNSKGHNPDSRMPSFDYLSGRQINSIIKYLKS